MERCAGIIVPAESVESHFRQIHPRQKDLVHRLEYGTFIADGPHCFADPTRTPSLVISNPIHNADDFEPLLSSIRHLIIDGYEFVVVFTGSGRAESKLHAMFKAFDLLEHVTHVPGLPSWPRIMAAADIFIRPRPLPWFDTFLLEAMAAGSAVAACKGGVDDLIVPDETAAIFDPTDELSITTTLKRLLGRREEARALTESAIRSLRPTHSASRMVDGLLRLYNKAHKSRES